MFYLNRKLQKHFRAIFCLSAPPRCVFTGAYSSYHVFYKHVPFSCSDSDLLFTKPCLLNSSKLTGHMMDTVDTCQIQNRPWNALASLDRCSWLLLRTSAPSSFIELDYTKATGILILRYRVLSREMVLYYQMKRSTDFRSLTFPLTAILFIIVKDYIVMQ